MKLYQFYVLFILIATFSISCTDEAKEREAIHASLQALKEEFPKEYITENSLDYFKELYEIAKQESASNLRKYIDGAESTLTMYEILVSTRYLFPDYEKLEGAQFDEYLKFLKSKGIGLWSNAPRVDNMKVTRYNFGFAGGATLTVKTSWGAVQSRTKVTPFASDLEFVKENDIWKVDIPSSIKLTEFETIALFKMMRTSKRQFREAVLDEIKGQKSDVEIEKALK